ncbi:MAG: Acyl-CoA N-acyltransferase [Modestobacter sp.]|nr:Acyl-CoA N-acyltransferase [Modestobacter sp.]
MVGLPAVELRPLRRADFPLLCRWPAEPLVARWWEEDPVVPTLRTLRVGPGTGPGADPTAVYLGVHDGKPFGLLQVYAFADAPESLAELTRVCPVPPGALSIDHLIGEPAARGPRPGPGTRQRGVLAGTAPGRGHLVRRG